jgi:hypothetical protein
MQPVDKTTKIIITIILTIFVFPIGLALGLHWKLISIKWFFILLVAIISFYGLVYFTIKQADNDKTPRYTIDDFVRDTELQNKNK